MYVLLCDSNNIIMSAKPRLYASGASKRKRKNEIKKQNVKASKFMHSFLRLKSQQPKQDEYSDNESVDSNESTGQDCAEPTAPHDVIDDGQCNDAAGVLVDALATLTASDEKPNERDIEVVCQPDSPATDVEQQNDERGVEQYHEDELEYDEDQLVEPVIRNRDFGYLPQITLSEGLTAKIVDKGSVYFQNKDSAELFPKLQLYGKQRGLTRNVFQITLPSGELCNRSWLLFSPKLQALFCFPCVLFTEAPHNMRSNLCEIGTGYNQFQKTDRLKEHEEGIFHRKAVLKWKMEEDKVKPEADELRDMLDMELRRYENRWKEILKRVAAAVRFLAKSNLSFRGHREDLEQKNPGNFISAIAFLAEFDPIMKTHLERIQPGRVHYLSPTIQNEFIELMGRQVENCIVSKIKEARYYSIMVDSTPDASHQEQMSMIIRYVSNFQICESFLGYYVIQKPDALHYELLVLDVLASLGLDFSYCRGQTYDNAATMSGERSGLQKRLLDRNPKATFLNCDDHSLNLAASHAAEVDPSIVTFFGTVHEVFVFFSHSPQRWAKMKDVCEISVKMESATRWSAREEATVSLSYSLNEIIELLDSMANAGKDDENLETRTKAANLLHAIQRYEFFAFLEFWSRLLRLINIAQKKFQQPALNIKEASEELKTLRAYLEDPVERENLIKDSIKRAEDGSETFGFTKIRRIRRVKAMAGEASRDSGLSMGEEIRRVAVEILDRLGSEMQDRFQKLTQHVERFGFLLDLKSLLQDQLTGEYKNKLMKDCLDFSAFYNELSARALFDDVMDARVIFSRKLLPETPQDFLKIIAKFGKDVFCNLQIAIQLLLTLSTSVASCERSFSKLKLIKNYLRTTMSQDRLKALAILSVESEIADQIDMDDIISEFARQKARKKI